MFVTYGVRRSALAVLAAVGVMVLTSAPAFAQEAKDPNPGALTLTGSIDVVNQYMFRGFRQNSSGIAIWPAMDLGISAYSGEGGLKSASINFGTWNSLHTGDTGQDGPSGKLWYESDFYATLGLGFGGGTSFSTTYTAYTSPNNGFTTVKEIMFKFAVDDSGKLGKAAVKPYIAVAREFDAEPGRGQADGGENAGTYVEIGFAPGYSASKASIAFPIKVGLSGSNYYELATPTGFEDNKFGYFSIAGIVTVPLGGTSSFGAWNIHGGVEYQKLGTTTEFFNGGESNQVIGSFGIGFSY
ncbi:MAG TPA: hypothetical protein VIR54_32480 [Vicinamibacterales bacterium]|jgi:Bacterial protein of unknown function (Gcw_chp).